MSSLALNPTFECLLRDRATRNENPSLRIALLKDEVLRLPRKGGRVRVLSGRAWLSFSAKDAILEEGESLILPRLRHAALVAATGDRTLFLEIH